MLSRRSVLFTAVAAGTALVAPAYATETKAFDAASFDAAQKAGRPIFVAIHASWCPTCKAQKPILSELMAEPKFKDLIYFIVNFDTQKDAVKFFGAQMSQPAAIGLIGGGASSEMTVGAARSNSVSRKQTRSQL